LLLRLAHLPPPQISIVDDSHVCGYRRPSPLPEDSRPDADGADLCGSPSPGPAS
jgi:hypothetical protein